MSSPSGSIVPVDPNAATAMQQALGRLDSTAEADEIQRRETSFQCLMGSVLDDWQTMAAENAALRKGVSHLLCRGKSASAQEQMGEKERCIKEIRREMLGRNESAEKAAIDPE